MSVIKQIALSICVTMVIVSIVSVLAPIGKLQGIFKYFISLFFITAVLMPFTEIKNIELFDFDYTQSENETQNYTQSLNEQTLALTKKLLKDKIHSFLNSNDITAQNIEFDIHTDDDNNIYISNLILTLDKKFKSKESEISSVTQREVGVKADFNYST